MRQSAICLVALSLLLVGCGSTGHPSGSRHVTGTLRWGIANTQDVPTLDPALASDPISISLASLVFGGLVRLDRYLRVQPDGADRWTISPDGTTYTFHLRPHLRFADGRPVTASDFASSLRRALGPQASAGTASFYLSAIRPGAGGITVRSPAVLRLRIRQPAAHFLSELAFPSSYVLDSRLLDRYGSNWTDRAAGFGPYVVRAWRHSRFLKLDRNPYYFGKVVGLPHIALTFFQNQQDAVTAYQRGQVDLVSGLQAGQALSGHIAGTQRVPGLAQDYLAFNTAHLPFHRLNTRRAFAAVWQPALSRRAMGDAAFVPTSFVPSAFGVRTPLWKPAISAATYLRRAHARSIHKPGRLTLVMPRDTRVFALARLLQHAWRSQLGVDVGLRQLNTSTYDTVLKARAFDLALVRWGADYPDPQDYLNTQLGTSGDNITGWSARAYDDALLLSDSYNPNDPRRTELFRSAGRLATSKLPLLPLDEPALTSLAATDLHGVHITSLGTIVINPASLAFNS